MEIKFLNPILAVFICKEKYLQEILFSNRGVIVFLKNQCPLALPAPLGIRIFSTIS